MGGTQALGRRLGMLMSIIAVGALAGSPISGAINTATGGFVAVGLYAGGLESVRILPLLTFVVTRFHGVVWGHDDGYIKILSARDDVEGQTLGRQLSFSTGMSLLRLIMGKRQLV